MGVFKVLGYLFCGDFIILYNLVWEGFNSIVIGEVIFGFSFFEVGV